jgi:ATP-dependent helicase/nuclease subunit B
MQLLRRRIRKLIAISPPPADDARLLNSATEFLQQLAPCSSEMDHVARKSLLEEIQQMKLWSELAAGDLSTNLRAWLAALPRQVRVLRSGPRPGRLHVAHVLSGGHSGRPNTFVIGLDDSRFPGAALQDPMLLDSERTRISALLPATTSETAERLRVLAGLFARLRGMVTLGYSCCDLVDDRELFPSPVVWAAFRIISGNRDGNHSDLLHWLEPAASFAPDAVEKSLHGTEWWLWRLCADGPVANALEAVAKQFPHLRRGLAAQLARSSHAVSCFDGHVPAAGAAMDPTLADGPVLSASALETIGRCPLAYFFGYGLGVRPPDELQLDPDRWLDPLSFGSLLHEVFRQSMTGLSAAGRLPVFDRDQQQLAAILNEQIQHYRDLVPPPSETAFRQQCRLLHRTARIFLRSEAAFCRTSQPQYFEVSLGLPSDALSAPPALPAGGLKPPLDDPQPIQVLLPGGTSIRACGRIDRIDLIGGDAPNQFSVWDYKTGSSSRYQAGDPFRQGRIIQNALYVAIAQAALRRAIGTQATVDLFGYFFPSLRSWGTRITWTADQLTEGKRIIQRLCQIVAGGTFLPTDNRDDCRFCDHQSVCGDLVAVTQASKLKLVNHENIMLQAIKELRGYVD